MAKSLFFRLRKIDHLGFGFHHQQILYNPIISHRSADAKITLICMSFILVTHLDLR
ncbi:hypothetical protein HanIR_Chr11g0552881 [Helianthus annuus]|nr:hypothetical protein HanIR_Chr11g0552881 [Helianthus annuus]